MNARRLSAAVGVLIVLAVTGGCVASASHGRQPGQPLKGAGVGYDQLGTAAVMIVDAAHPIALPVERPPGLSMLAAPALRASRAEVALLVDTQDLIICQFDGSEESSCELEGGTVIHQGSTPDGQTWMVTLLPDDIQNGTGDASEIIAWFAEVDYTDPGATPGWITDLATQHGS